METFETFVTVIVVVTISLAEAILTDAGAIVKRLEGPREQRQIGLAGTFMEKGPGIYVLGIPLLPLIFGSTIHTSSTFGVEIVLSLNLVDEAAEGRSLGDRNDGRVEGEKG